jgi:hypothetical protein
MRLIGLWIFTVFAVLVLTAPDPFVSAPDLGWHIRSGDEIVSRGEVPKTAWFTYTVPDFPWIDHEWLHDVAISCVWRYNGIEGVRTFYGILAFFLLTILTCGLAPQSQSVECRTFMLLPLGVALVAMRAMRTQIITALLFSVTYWALRRYVSSRDPRAVWCLPLVFAAWANLHAGFPIGFVLMGVFLAGNILERALSRVSTSHENAKEQFIVIGSSLALSILATLLNPYGARIYQEIIRTVADPFPSQQVVEWLPTSLASYTGEAFFVVVGCTMLALATGRLRTGVTDKLLLGAFLFLGLVATRHAIFYLIIAYPLLQESVPELDAIIRREWRTLVLSVSSVGLVCSAVFAASTTRADARNINSQEQMYPARTLDALPGLAEQKRLFHNFEWGGFILLRDPKARTFIDGRMTQWEVQKKSFLRTYIEVKNLSPGWDETLRRYGVDAVMVKRSEPIASALKLLPQEWRLTYEDQVTTVFERRR